MKTLSAHHTRREVLSKTLKLAGASLILPEFLSGSSGAGGYAPKLSLEGYIWTQYFAARKLTLTEGEEEALRESHAAGYPRIELSSEFLVPGVRERTRDLLAKYSLKPESIYAGTTMHEPRAAEMSIHSVLEMAAYVKPLGTRVIVTDPSPKPKDGRKTDNELKTQVHYVNQLGSALHRQGIRLLLHHHTPELRENGREWWYELDHTNPKTVGCCVDVHWAYRGGQEVMPFLHRVGMRLEDVHLRNSQHGVWMEDFRAGRCRLLSGGRVPASD